METGGANLSQRVLVSNWSSGGCQAMVSIRRMYVTLTVEFVDIMLQVHGQGGQPLFKDVELLIAMHDTDSVNRRICDGIVQREQGRVR